MWFTVGLMMWKGEYGLNSSIKEEGHNHTLAPSPLFSHSIQGSVELNNGEGAKV